MSLPTGLAYARDPLCHGSAAEDAGIVHVERQEYEAAIVQFVEARSAYEHADARRDIDRVRARLRRLGVRDGHGPYPSRPVSGWASLTDTEARIAGFVSEGLTNRQVADRTFLSPHTVAFHLRRVYAKLGLGTRVELTRVALQARTPGAVLATVHDIPTPDRDDRVTEPADVDCLRQEIDGLRTAMASRASIEQAKGVLIAMGGWGPEEAWTHLVQISQHTNLKVRDVASDILSAVARPGRHARQEVIEALRAELNSRPRPAE